MKIEHEPLGFIRTNFKEMEGMPIQSAKSKDEGRVEIKKELQEGLKDLDGFSHLILIYQFHKAKGFELKAVPFLDETERGIFSIRAPKRPNPIGISIVRLKNISENIIYFEGADMLDGTPLLDIKPYMEKFDKWENTKQGWLEGEKGSYISDGRFR